MYRQIFNNNYGELRMGAELDKAVLTKSSDETKVALRPYRDLRQPEIDEIIRMYPDCLNREICKKFRISIDTLQNYFSKPLGLKKSCEFCNKYQGTVNKIELTEKQIKWLKAHFKHTKNDDICDRLGIGPATLHRLARKYNLKKSHQFMKKMVQNASDHQKVYMTDEERKIRSEAQKKRWEEKKAAGDIHWCGFLPGVTNVERLGREREKERIRKSADSTRLTRQAEKRRVLFGLPQRTKLRFTKLQPAAYSYKHSMIKKNNYFAVEGETALVAYDEHTKRSLVREKTAARHGLKIVAAGSEY